MNESNDSKFVTRKWNTVNDNSKANYGVGNEITYNREVLKSSLCDAFILVICGITVRAAPEILVAFKNCPPFSNCITKVAETTIDDAENLDLVMPMYSLIEYSYNYPEKQEVYDINFKSFEYKAKLLGNNEAQTANAANEILKNETIAVPLKYLSNFSRSFEMPLINCKVELKLKWTKYCFLSADGNENEANNNDNTNNIIFTIKDAKL